MGCEDDICSMWVALLNVFFLMYNLLVCSIHYCTTRPVQ